MLLVVIQNVVPLYRWATKKTETKPQPYFIFFRDRSLTPDVNKPRLHSGGATTFIIMTFSITTLSMTTFSINTLSMITLSITTLSMTTFSITIKICDT
jgi:hypothetical protein